MKKYIVSFSGGKDSSAMLLRMIELDYKIDEVLFCDTGKEFPQLYKYVERMKNHVQQLGIKFTILTPEKSWDDWFFGKVTRGKMKGKKRGWPLMFFHCYWSRESKFLLLDPLCYGHERYIGFGADETKRLVSGRKKEGYNFPLADWGWTEKNALEYLLKVGWCEQFHLDFNRTGCFLCPKQGEESLKTLCDKYPEQWDELLRYAKLSNNDFKPGVGLKELKEIEDQVKYNRTFNKSDQFHLDFGCCLEEI